MPPYTLGSNRRVYTVDPDSIHNSDVEMREEIRWIACVLLSLLIISLSTAAQNSPSQRSQQPPGTASISGVVVAMGTNAPISGANVEARRTACGNTNAGESASATTNADGKFVLENLRAGGWCIGAAYPGGQYTPSEYLQRGYLGRGVTLSVSDNQKAENIRIAMAPTGGIAGRLTDADGDPLGRARVMVMESFYEEGQRRLYTLNVVQSDDLGEFRFYWLPPGQYYIAAIPEDTQRQRVMFSVAPPGSGGHRSDALSPVVTTRITQTGELVEEAYQTIYYPGSTDPNRALPVDVRPGQTTDGISLNFAGAKVRAWHIRGNVSSTVVPPAPRGGATGFTPPPAQLRLAPRDWTSIAVMPSAISDPNGNFEIA